MATLEELIAQYLPGFQQQYSGYQRADTQQGSFWYDPTMLRYAVDPESGVGGWQQGIYDETGQFNWGWAPGPISSDDISAGILNRGFLFGNTSPEAYAQNLARQSALNLVPYAGQYFDTAVDLIRQIDPTATEADVFNAAQKASQLYEAPGRYMPRLRVNEIVANTYLSDKLGRPVTLSDNPEFAKAVAAQEQITGGGFNLREALPYLAMFVGPWLGAVAAPYLAGAAAGGADLATAGLAAEAAGAPATTAFTAGQAAGVGAGALGAGEAGLGSLVAGTAPTVPAPTFLSTAANLAGAPAELVTALNNPFVNNAALSLIRSGLTGQDLDSALQNMLFSTVGSGVGLGAAEVASSLGPAISKVSGALANYATQSALRGTDINLEDFATKYALGQLGSQVQSAISTGFVDTPFGGVAAPPATPVDVTPPSLPETGYELTPQELVTIAAETGDTNLLDSILAAISGQEPAPIDVTPPVDVLPPEVTPPVDVLPPEVTPPVDVLPPEVTPPLLPETGYELTPQELAAIAVATGDTSLLNSVIDVMSGQTGSAGPLEIDITGGTPATPVGVDIPVIDAGPNEGMLDQLVDVNPPIPFIDAGPNEGMLDQLAGITPTVPTTPTGLTGPATGGGGTLPTGGGVAPPAFNLGALFPLLAAGLMYARPSSTPTYTPPAYTFTSGIFDPLAYSQYGRTMEQGVNLPPPRASLVPRSQL